MSTNISTGYKSMSVLYAILLGIIQGITEFLPVSSLGHVIMVQGILNIQRGPGVLFEVMLHVGTLAAVFSVFRKDIVQITQELLGMLMDTIGNANLYIHNKRTGDNLYYARIVHGGYRKFAMLVLVSMIPTAALGYTARRLVVKAVTWKALPGIGFLLTGILLLVIDLSNSGGKKTYREAGYDSAMWIGICQGLSIFPGISRSGLTMSAALLCGFSRTFAVKFSYIMSIPAVIGAMILELGDFTAPNMTAGIGFTFVLGMLAAGITGYFVIRFLLKLVHKKKFRYFAYYCFAAGVLALYTSYFA